MRRMLISMFALILAGGVVLAGCGSDKTAGTGQEQARSQGQVSGSEEGQDAGNAGPQVILTIYFAKFSDTDAWLVPVERPLPHTEEVARAAIQELIKGPNTGSGLKAVIPATVQIRSISIANGVCSLDLSKEILTDAAGIGVSATTEELLLAAVADTLTEFPTINQVKLTIEGKSSGMVDGRAVEDLWGHVGLPDILVRNETLIKPE